MCEDPEGTWSPGRVISYCIVVEGTLFPEEKKQQVFTDFELGYVILSKIFNTQTTGEHSVKS